MAPASRDAVRYVEGAVLSEATPFESHAAVVARATRAAFRNEGELRAIAALWWLERGERAGSLPEVADVSREAAATYRERYGDRLADEPHEPDEWLVEELDVGAETARQVRAVTRSGVSGEDGEGGVLAFAVEHYFARHDALCEAAVAARYAEGRMTTGRASDLLDVRKGPEIESILRDHGVEPRVGPSEDPEQFRAELEAARRAFGGGDTDETSEDDSESGEE